MNSGCYTQQKLFSPFVYHRKLLRFKSVRGNNCRWNVFFDVTTIHKCHSSILQMNFCHPKNSPKSRLRVEWVRTSEVGTFTKRVQNMGWESDMHLNKLAVSNILVRTQSMQSGHRFTNASSRLLLSNVPVKTNQVWIPKMIRKTFYSR